MSKETKSSVRTVVARAGFIEEATTGAAAYHAPLMGLVAVALSQAVSIQYGNEIGLGHEQHLVAGMHAGRQASKPDTACLPAEGTPDHPQAS